MRVNYCATSWQDSTIIAPVSVCHHVSYAERYSRCMRGAAHVCLENALEVLLSRTSLDLGPRVSHHTSNHPIETGQLSLLRCLMWVDLTKTGGRAWQARQACWGAPCSGTSWGPDDVDGRPVRMIAVSVAVHVRTRVTYQQALILSSACFVLWNLVECLASRQRATVSMRVYGKRCACAEGDPA